MQKSLRVADLAELLITVPSLDRQRKVMQAVTCLYENIESLQACIANKEALLTAVAAKELL